jgi:hypothetical protein
MSADQSVEVIEWTRAERRRLRESAAELKRKSLDSPWSLVSNMRCESPRVANFVGFHISKEITSICLTS